MLIELSSCSNRLFLFRSTADMDPCMTSFRTLIGTILTTAAGALAMYWPVAVMVCLLALALLGVALDREPLQAKSRDCGLYSDRATAQDRNEPATAFDVLKAA
jgi:hypothetical protein